MKRSLVLAALLVASAPGPAHGAISYVSRATNESTSTTLTITRPSGTNQDDLLLATVSGAGGDTISAPNGWTLVADTTAPTGGLRALTYLKVATGSEPSSYTFSSPAARSSSGGILTLRGVNTVVPLDDVATDTGASGQPAGPPATTSAPGAWVLTAAAVRRDMALATPSGSIERWQRRGNLASTAVSTFVPSVAGATPAKTPTVSNTSSAWTAHTIAVNDSASAGLTVATPGAASFSASLDAGDATAAWTVPVSVRDTRTTGLAGWSLQLTSTTLTAAGRSLATGATRITGTSGLACGSGAPCTLPVNDVALPVAAPAGTPAPSPVTLANAAASTGVGRVALTVDLATLVPQNAFAGTYTSTVTISVVSGP